MGESRVQAFTKGSKAGFEFVPGHSAYFNGLHDECSCGDSGCPTPGDHAGVPCKGDMLAELRHDSAFSLRLKLGPLTFEAQRFLEAKFLVALIVDTASAGSWLRDSMDAHPRQMDTTTIRHFGARVEGSLSMQNPTGTGVRPPHQTRFGPGGVVRAVDLYVSSSPTGTRALAPGVILTDSGSFLIPPAVINGSPISWGYAPAWSLGERPAPLPQFLKGPA